MLRRLTWIVLIALAGCAAPDQRAPDTTATPLPQQYYLDAAREGTPVYRIEPEQSLLLVHVGRAGAARRLGHDHAVASEHLAGFVGLGGENNDARADLAFPVRELVVDKPEYRRRLGLDTEPTEEDIAGTYGNMLKGLEPDTYPWVTARAQIAAGEAGTPELAVSVTLHGNTAEFLVPVTIETTDEQLTARGSTVIRHSDFALAPFSAMGGLLRVADELEIDLEIVARRILP